MQKLMSFQRHRPKTIEILKVCNPLTNENCRIKDCQRNHGRNVILVTLGRVELFTGDDSSRQI
jgi:hypothetical protein